MCSKGVSTAVPPAHGSPGSAASAAGTTTSKAVTRMPQTRRLGRRILPSLSHAGGTPRAAYPSFKGCLGSCLGAEGLRVPGARDGEPRAVPVEAAVVEAAGRAAVRVVALVDRLGLDQVA